MTNRRADLTLALTTLATLLIFGWTVFVLIKALPMLATPLPVPPPGWWRP